MATEMNAKTVTVDMREAESKQLKNSTVDALTSPLGSERVDDRVRDYGKDGGDDGAEERVRRSGARCV